MKSLSVVEISSTTECKKVPCEPDAVRETEAETKAALIRTSRSSDARESDACGLQSMW